MGTRYLFEKAVKITQSLSPRDKTLVLNLCRAIQKSQDDLLVSAHTLMSNCLLQCRGLCCKSLDIDAVFSLWDFIFILMLTPDLKDEIQQRLESFTHLYLSPCPFLREGRGPCIFPDGIKAQICVITFCSGEEQIKDHIKTVNLNFYKLCWQIQWLRLKHTAQKLTGFSPSL